MTERLLTLCLSLLLSAQQVAAQTATPVRNTAATYFASAPGTQFVRTSRLRIHPVLKGALIGAAIGGGTACIANLYCLAKESCGGMGQPALWALAGAGAGMIIVVTWR